MAYYKTWRRCRAEVLTLAANSSGDEDNQPIFTASQYPSGDEHEDFNDALPQPVQANSSDNGSGDSSTTLESDLDSDLEDYMYDSSGESDIEIDTNDTPTLDDKLRKWATENNLTRACVNGLLVILRHEGLRLPKDARTLLKTPRNVVVAEKCGGEYAYYGVERYITKTLVKQENFVEERNLISLKINIDGIPLYKSSKDQFWPILASFGNFHPGVVALFRGKTKPEPVEHFLQDFIHEYSTLVDEGITYDDKKFAVHVEAFICDAPARSFLKCTKGHSGYHACERCTVKGAHVGGRITYDTVEETASRTNDQFLEMAYSPDHQLQRSPLIEIGFPCVTSFVLDYMHLVCLGVVRRILIYLKKGPRKCKLSQQLLNRISEKLSFLNGQLPSEFARQPRSLDDLERWKATEFRQFVLYTGPLVLNGIVDDNLYVHFLTLTVAISICLDTHHDKRNEYLPYARQLLNYFVENCQHIYGPTFNVYNVHSLTHLCEDVDHFQCSLNELSAFPFESKLNIVKKLVRNAHNPIAQATKRMMESEEAGADKAVHRNHLHISVKRKDSCFLLRTEQFAFVKEKRNDGHWVCDITRKRHLQNLFTRPCQSMLFNIAFITNDNIGNCRRQILHEDELYHKGICLEYNNGFVLMPMLHGQGRR
ncbi:uncharacterized protein LOC110990667 [Acanthaster planci]|uniref:Uncharacterized protein LOC110990667 n=1 Tax=Acanthaster planci TaxID=133434 RepID=A0A8B8A252_ACAPL|nr:uncharacterized protein LOC110990667 [Acanthaster planci]